MLGNLGRKYRYILDNIKFVFLCHHDDVIKYGFPKIIKPLLDDIKTLEQMGITFNFNNISHTFLVTISFIASDNLAANMCIGGFMESFSKTNRPCRTCMVERGHLSNFNANSFRIVNEVT